MPFIAGPTGSGKTVFGIGLYRFISGKARLDNDAIELGSTEFSPSLDDLYSYMLKTGKYPKATTDRELRIYRFKIPKLFGDIISVEFVDYRGELLETLPEWMRRYNEILEVISQYFDNEFLEKVMVRSVTFDDLKNIKIPENEAIYVLRAYLISQLYNNQKLIFLLDGKKILDFLNGSDVSIVDDLNTYKECIKGKKTACFVITKADMLDNLFQYETGKTQIENKKDFIKWIDKKLSREEDTLIPSYVELKNMGVKKIFATTVRPVKYSSKSKVNVWGFEEIKKWVEDTSLIGGGIL